MNRDAVDGMLAQWRDQRPDVDTSPIGIVGRVSRAARLLERKLQDNYDRYGLQGWEFDVLATLRRAGKPYRLTAGQLVASSMVTSGAITNRIDRLAGRGLVTREVDPGNRRSVLITLTPAGRKLVDEVVVAHTAYEAGLLSALSPRQRDQLAGLLRTLLVGLGDQATH
jgi:DNA-binding MarR family transcriptional regulator